MAPNGLKVHWVPFHVPDDALFGAFEQYGKVQEITRVTWKTVLGLSGATVVLQDNASRTEAGRHH